MLSQERMDQAVMMANGIPLVEIAKEYNCTIQNISQLKRNKEFAAYLEKLMKEKSKETKKKLQSYGPDAVDYVYSVMNNTEETTKLRLDAAFRILDFTVPKPKNEDIEEIVEDKVDLFSEIVKKKKEVAKLVVIKDADVEEYIEEKIEDEEIS